jgi:hypothetical protein
MFGFRHRLIDFDTRGFFPTVFLTLEGSWVEVALRLPAYLVDGLALELLEVVPAKTVPGA